MAFGRTVIGCTPYVGGVIAAVYSTMVYLTAFGLELGWIIEANAKLPTPAYILTAEYFCSLLLSLFLVVGLVLKNSKYLLGWLIMMMAFFFPECGLVLAISLYYYGLDKPHGLAEFIFYVCRAVLNVLCIVCVHLLHGLWKKEKAVLRRLENFQLGSLFSEVDGASTKDCHDASNGHVNQEFVFRSSRSQESEVMFVSSTAGSSVPPSKLSRSRSFSSVNTPDQQSSPMSTTAPPPSCFYWNAPSGSEFDAASFNEFLSWKMRNRPGMVRGYSSEAQSDIFPSSSGLMGVWEHTPATPVYPQYLPSETQSTYSTQSLERLKHKKSSPLRRARSLSDIQTPTPADYFVLQKLQEPPFQYLQRPGSVLIEDGDSNSTHSIRDVAL